MRRILFFVAALILLFAPAAARAQPDDVRCHSDEGVLPAGVYWAFVGWYEEHLDCPRPGVALVAGIHDSGAQATRALRGLRDLELEPGYPWVVHTRYAGIEGDGVAVVIGMFDDEDTARGWSTRHRPHAVVDVRAVLEPASAIARFDAHSGGTRPDPIPVVTQIVGPEAVPAWTIQNVRRLERRPGATPAPICRVRPGRVFVFTRPPRERLSIAYYGYVPVRCGRERAWIRAEHTRHTAVTWTETTGETFVSQVMSVECDTPSHQIWRLDGQRRTVERREAGSCGEP